MIGYPVSPRQYCGNRDRRFSHGEEEDEHESLLWSSRLKIGMEEEANTSESSCGSGKTLLAREKQELSVGMIGGGCADSWDLNLQKQLWVSL